MQDMPVAVLRGTHDELGALPGRGKGGSVAVFHQFLLILPAMFLNEAHGGEDGGFCLIRRKCCQSLLRRQLDIHAEPIRQITELPHQLRGCAGDGLGMDIAVEAVFLPQDPQRLDHSQSGVVRAFQNTAGEKQTLDIITAVKLNGQIGQFLGGEGGAPGVIAAAVDAVLAVVHAAIGHEYLQKGNTSAVCGKAVAAAGNRG